MDARIGKKYKKIHSHAKAKVLSYIVENWTGAPTVKAKNCLNKSITSRKKDFAIMGIETNLSPASLELTTYKVTNEVFKELYGSYPKGAVMKDTLKPIRWHKAMAESLVDEGLVK